MAVAAGVAATGAFIGIGALGYGALEGLGQLGDALGPGYRDLLQGVAGMGLVLAGPKIARSATRPSNLHPDLADLPPNVARMPQGFQDEYAAARAAGWKKPNGDTWWPPNDGAAGPPRRLELPAGKALDRYNGEGGSFMSPRGVPMSERAMAPDPTRGLPANYRVAPGRKLPVEEADVAPWFDEPGGGQQYKLIDPDGSPGRYRVSDALDAGLLVTD